MTIACVGDSLCEAGSAVVAAIGDVYAERAVALGVRGISTHGAAAVKWDVSGARLVVVSLGTNDGTAPHADDVRQLDAWLRAQGADVVWMAPPLAPVASPVYGRAQAMQEVLATCGVRYLAAQPGVALGADMTHPTRSGAQVLARALVSRYPRPSSTSATSNRKLGLVLGVGLLVAVTLAWFTR